MEPVAALVIRPDQEAEGMVAVLRQAQVAAVSPEWCPAPVPRLQLPTRPWRTSASRALSAPSARRTTPSVGGGIHSVEGNCRLHHTQGSHRRRGMVRRRGDSHGAHLVVRGRGKVVGRIAHARRSPTAAGWPARLKGAASRPTALLRRAPTTKWPGRPCPDEGPASPSRSPAYGASTAPAQQLPHRPRRSP